MLAGAGDELQGIKKGIIEMADGIAINKADGENLKATLQAQADAQHALHLQSASASGWTPKVLTVSSTENKGIEDVWKLIGQYHKLTIENGYFLAQRKLQKKQWLEESIENYFRAFMSTEENQEKKQQLQKEVMDDTLIPAEAARKFWDGLITQIKSK